jgi:predicted nucleic acid-binding protein
MPIISASPENLLALDSDIFTHLRNKQPYVLRKIAEHSIHTKTFPAIPSTTFFEANFGIQKALVKNEITLEIATSQKKEIDNLLVNHSVIDFNQRASEIAAYIFARLSQSDKNKHWRDLFIVATAVSHNYGLATQNKKDMELIANHLPEGVDLRLAIWKPEF